MPPVGVSNEKYSVALGTLALTADESSVQVGQIWFMSASQLTSERSDDDVGMMAGMPLTMCSELYGEFVPGHDAYLVRRLREAGFVIVGKTSMPEMGILPTTEPPRFGAARTGGFQRGPVVGLRRSRCSRHRRIRCSFRARDVR